MFRGILPPDVQGHSPARCSGHASSLVSSSTASTRLSPARLASLLGPPLLVMAAIFLLSAQPSTGTHPPLVVLLRKLGHVTEYAVLTLCWWRALRGLGIS